MASISSDANGLKRLLVVLPDGSRKPIRLGKMPLRTAEGFKVKVEALVSAKLTNGLLDDETSRWLAGLDDQLLEKLAGLGLATARRSVTLGQLVDGWLERRGKTLKPGTLVRLQQGKRSLLGHFGANRALGSIIEGEVEDYRAALLSEGLAEATVRKRCSDARVWFRYAMRHGYVRANPFEVVPTAAVATSHLAYISEADAKRVLAEIANPDLRLIFVLSRWGGLRTVSEPKALTWDCIDWQESRIVVKSPKTDRHAGHEQRVIPMFPELVGPLQEAFDRAEPGQALVLPVLSRISSAGLRKPMLAAVRRAGLSQWARLWHNMRSSRQTDLEARFASHVVCAWMGNSATIARKHYLQVLESDFAKAIGENVAQKAAHNAAQNAAASTGSDPKIESTSAEKTPVLQGCSLQSTDGFENQRDGSSDPDGI